jgi:hypothetical protein
VLEVRRLLGTVGATYEIGLVEELVEAAHARGARVAAHTTSPLVTELIRAGIDSVEHGTSVIAGRRREPRHLRRRPA